MVIKRVYNAIGEPALVLVFVSTLDGGERLLRLVYARAPGFGLLWSEGVDPVGE